MHARMHNNGGLPSLIVCKKSAADQGPALSLGKSGGQSVKWAVPDLSHRMGQRHEGMDSPNCDDNGVIHGQASIRRR